MRRLVFVPKDSHSMGNHRDDGTNINRGPVALMEILARPVSSSDLNPTAAEGLVQLRQGCLRRAAFMGQSNEEFANQLVN